MIAIVITADLLESQTQTMLDFVNVLRVEKVITGLIGWCKTDIESAGEKSVWDGKMIIVGLNAIVVTLSWVEIIRYMIKWLLI